MKIKALATVSIAALACAGLAACGGGSKSADSGAEGKATGKGIVTAFGSEPQNPLIPANTNETAGGRVVDSINSRLVYYTKDAKPELDLAESIEPNADSTEFTVKLKKDRTFSDGSPITADSFINAWNWSANPKNGMNNSYFFELIDGYATEGDVPTLKGLTKVDDQTFKIKLSTPTGDFPDRLGYSAYSPLPEVALKDMEAYGQKPSVTSGPYVVDSWTHNESIKLRPNPKYNGPNKPANGGIDFNIYTKSEAAYADVQSGKLDLLDEIPSSSLKTWKKDFPKNGINTPVAVVQTFTIHSSKAPHFSGEEGKLRRQALSMAIDRAAICKTIFSGARTPADEFTSPALSDYKSVQSALGDVTKNAKFDAKKAKELWEKADAMSKFTGKFTIAYNSDSAHQEWVDAVANQLSNNLGIKAEGKPYPDFKSLRDNVTNEKEESGFRTGWQADYPGMSNFLEPIFSSNGSSNDGKYSNPKVDQLLKEANAASDAKARAEKFVEVEKILLDELPAIPLWYQTTTAVWSKDVSDVNIGWNSQPLYWMIKK